MKNKWMILTIATFVASSGVRAAERPNVILVVTDDQGYGDIAAHGNPVVETPNMDRLHDQSIRLTDYHVDPTCAPTRGALMTGKFSHHARVWHTVRGGNHLREGEVTMAEVFKHNGYDTAMFGKWHLGANYPYRPMDRGFDEWLGLGDGGPGTSDCHFWTDRVNDVYWHNGEREFKAGFNPDVFYGEAMKYVKNHDGNHPFFVYLPTYLPHKPYTFPAPDFHQKYLDKGMEKETAAFYACIERVDLNLGRLRQLLEDEGIADNTILIFMTDNGSTHVDVFNAGMAGHKGSTSEGGHRVPCFIYWPKGNLGAAREVSELTAHIDLLPTLTELCGMQLPQPIDFDGRSLVPLLRESGAKWPDRTLVVEKQREVEHNRKYNAIMNGKWRLLGHNKLFNIETDPGQKNNVAADHPEIVKELLHDFEDYWSRVTPDDRSFPTPIAGTPFDKEIALSISELRDGSGYTHGDCAEGVQAEGVWHIEAAESGVYEIEVSRWPTEADATMKGVPIVTKTVDAWSTRDPKKELLTKGKLKSLPVEFVSLKVGDFYEKRAVSDADKSLVFNVTLPKGRTVIDSVFYDKKGQRITNAYYVYVRKKG